MNDQTSNPLDIISKALADLAENRTSIDAVYADLRFLEFKSKNPGDNYGKGIIFTGESYTRQFVFSQKPDKFLSTEHIGLTKDKGFYINNNPVINERELGPTVTKSSLKEVGRLKGLIVDGSVNINQYLFYNGSTDRLGLGTDEPNASFSVAENAIEVMLGTTEDMHGMVGTHASTDFDIVTDNTARITVKGNGDIVLGNTKRNPIKVSVNGKLSIGVTTPDPNVDLHVAGPVRLHNHLHMYASAPPSAGSYSVGDIVWNEAARVGGNVGWICLRAGSPGAWYPFGDIKERG